MLKLFRRFHLNLKNKKRFEEQNTGLPTGAVRYEFDAWDDKLEVLQMKLISHQCAQNEEVLVDMVEKVPGLKMEISSVDNPLFSYEEHPLVRGNRWCRGYSIQIDTGTVIIFLHRMDTKRPKDFKFPLLYTTGCVSDEEVTEIANTFFEFLENVICRQLNLIQYKKLQEM